MLCAATQGVLADWYRSQGPRAAGPASGVLEAVELELDVGVGVGVEVAAELALRPAVPVDPDAALDPAVVPIERVAVELAELPDRALLAPSDAPWLVEGAPPPRPDASGWFVLEPHAISMSAAAAMARERRSRMEHLEGDAAAR